MGFPLHPLPTERAPWVPSGQPLTSWSPAWSRRAPASRPRRASPLPAPAGGGTASGARAKVLADSCSGDGPVLRGSTSTGEQSTVPGAWAGRLMWTRPPTPGADPSPPSSDPFPSWAPPGLAIPACPLAPSSPWFACEQAGWGVGGGQEVGRWPAGPAAVHLPDPWPGPQSRRAPHTPGGPGRCRSAPPSARPSSCRPPGPPRSGWPGRTGS